MAVGLASGVANAIVDALCSSVAWSEPAGFYVQLHIGDPGPAGTSNPAVNTTRVAATFSAAAAGAATNTSPLAWTGVPAAEMYTHVSFWSAATAATYLGSDLLNTPAILAVGNDFTIPVGDIDLSLIPVAV